MGSYPWWPAKLMDPARDLSFPPDADPPRPTSIPIRCAALRLVPATHAGCLCCAGSHLQLPGRYARQSQLPFHPLLACLPSRLPACCRFFGTFEFQWIGSKRQLTDWEEVGANPLARLCPATLWAAVDVPPTALPPPCHRPATALPPPCLLYPLTALPGPSA